MQISEAGISIEGWGKHGIIHYLQRHKSNQQHWEENCVLWAGVEGKLHQMPFLQDTFYMIHFCNAGFLNLGATDILGQIIFHCEGLSCAM